MTASRPSRSEAAGRWAALIVAFGIVLLTAIVPAARAATSLGDYVDRFPLWTYSGSAGSIPWASSWIEVNDDGNNWTGTIRVENEPHCATNPCLTFGRTTSSDASISRLVDLSTATTATLAFDYKRHDHAGTAGHVRLEISATGTGGWVELHDFDLSVTDPGQVAFAQEITDWISPTTTIRFSLIGSSNNSHLNVDNVRIELFAEDNVAPALDPIANATISEEAPFAFTATASDANGADVLSFSLDGSEPAGAVMSSSGDFSWTPTEAQGPGIYSFDVIVADDGTPALEDRQTVTLTVAETNAPPVLEVIGDKPVVEGSTLAFVAAATDPDTPPAALTFSLAGSPPSGAAMTAAGAFSWTPTEAQGPGDYTFDVTVTDDGLPDGFRSDSETITVSVGENNQTPILAAISDKNVDEGTNLSFTATATDSDLPVNNLAYSLVGAPAGASMTSGGLFSWTPTESQGPRTYTFDITVVDDGVPVRSDTESVTVTVAEANIAPIINTIGTKTVNEGELLTFTARATDPDSPADSFAFSLFGAPTGASITPGGTFTWRPSEIQGPSTYHFEVVATDTGLPPMSRRTDVTVIVREVNSAPVMTPISPRTVAEGAPFTLATSVTDSDIPANLLAYSLTGAPPGVTVSNAGVISWTPTESQGPGSYSFDVVVADSGSPSLSDSQAVTIDVTDGNNAPVIDPIGTVKGIEGDLITFTATATDPDVPANSFWFSLSGNAPAGATISTGGVFRWNPTEIQGPGSYRFSVVVTDTGSPARSSTRQVTIVVSEANLPPRLDMLADYSVEAGLPFLLLASASDRDLPAQALSYSAEGLPEGAELSPAGELTWLAADDTVGAQHEVTITVTDDGSPAMSDTGSFTLTVVDANLAPVLAPIADSQLQLGETLRFAAAATDGDGPLEDLRFSLGPDAPSGAAIDDLTGRFEWSPTGTQTDASHRITVTVTDSGPFPKSDSVTFTVLVGRLNIPPLLSHPGDQRNIPGEQVSLVVPGADPDGYPNSLVYRGSNLPPGLTIDAATGAIAGTVGFDALSNSPFTVEVSASDGRSSTTVTFVWEISGVANPGSTISTRNAVVGGIIDVTSRPAPPLVSENDVTRSFVIMSRALRSGVSEMSLPIVLLVAVIGGLIAFGRIGIVPVLRRGTRHEGVIRRYDPTLGSGLVIRSSDGAEVFVHLSAIARRDRSILTAGDSVSFKTIDGAYRDLVTKLRRHR